MLFFPRKPTQMPVTGTAWNLSVRVSYICDFHYGLQVINYLDDFAGCNTPDKASTEYDILGQVLKEYGLENLDLLP
jgi:hypothetical protein